MRKNSAKIYGLMFLAMMMFIYIPNEVNQGKVEENINQKSYLDTPESATLDFLYFSVNNTELYEDGIYYCFRNDSLEFNLITSSDVDEVVLDIDHPTLSSENFGTLTLNNLGGTSNITWGNSLSISGTKEVAMYNATIKVTDTDTSISKYFLFNVSIMNPQPRIIKAEITEPIYNGENPHQIFEGEVFPVYHFAKINITAYIANIDGLAKIDSVSVVYENGKDYVFVSKPLTSIGSYTIGSYTALKYVLTENITIDLSSLNDDTRANWTIGNYYDFKLLVNDTEGASFDFEWNLLISNQAPTITEFTVTGGATEEDFVGINKKDHMDFTITANGTDMETNTIFGDSLYNYSKSFKPSVTAPINNSQSNITNWPENGYDLNTIYTDDTNYQTFTFPNLGATYGFNFSLSRDYCFIDDDMYKEWTLEIRLIISTVQTLNLELYNYDTKSWQLIGSNILSGHFGEVSLYFLNSTSFDQNIQNYFETENQTNLMQARLKSATGVSIPITIDKIAMSMKINQKIGFSDMYLKIYSPIANPNADLGSSLSKYNPVLINLNHLYMNDWDNTGTLNRWSLNYSIPISNTTTYLIGAWSFVLEVYDFGTTSYSEINPTEINGNNQLSEKGYVSNDKTRSYAVETKMINVGLPMNEILNVNEVSISDPTPAQDENATISITLDDYDNGNSYTNINQSYNCIFEDVAVQNGNPWDQAIFDINTLPPSPTYSSKVKDTLRNLDDDNGDLSSASAMQYLDGNTFRFRINEPNPDPYINQTFAYILPYELDTRYWWSEENISSIWFEVNQKADFVSEFSSYEIIASQIQFWNFQGSNWTTPNDGNSVAEWYDTGNYDEITLMKFDTRPQADETWFSYDWNETETIKQCINQNDNNKMYLRVLVTLGGAPLYGGIPYDFNITLDYAKLTVEYKNEYYCKMNIWDSLDNTKQEIYMTQTGTGANTRTWSYELPNSLIAARSYHFSFEAQNGNSSIHFDKGQIEAQRDGYYSSDFIWQPYYNTNFNINSSYTFLPEKTNVSFSNYQFATVTNLHRHQEPLIFNGTTVFESDKFNLDDVVTFKIQLRQSNMETMDEWIEIEGSNYLDTSGLKILKWDNTTNSWNATLLFTHDIGGTEWRSGVWFYRVMVETSENIINVSDWGEFRLHNYQPKQIELQQLPTGSYYRVIDECPYTLSFVDMEGDNSTFNPYAGDDYEIFIKFLVQNRDNNLAWEKWDSGTIADYQYVLENSNRFIFDGTVSFGREIQIGSYSDVYIQVKDTDQDWPQVGTLKISNRVFEILNNEPEFSSSLDSNSSESIDQVYRNNWININCMITDNDDFDYQVQPLYLNLTYNYDYEGGTSTTDLSSEFQLINYTAENYKQWEYDLFVDIRNKTGFWNITTDFEDPDGATLKSGEMSLSIEILNNLPVLQNIQFINLETGEIAYVTNQTDFGIYRGNETLQIIADLYDVEDTWLSEFDYSIDSVTFNLKNEYSGLANPQTYSNEDFLLTLTRNGSIPFYQTSENIETLLYASNFNVLETDSYTNTILSVKDNDGTTASTEAITNNDSEWQNITYYYSNQKIKGGEYFVNMSGLPRLFDLHTISDEYTLSFEYKVSGGAYNVYAYNIDSEKWDLLGTQNMLSSSIFTTKEIQLNSQTIRSYVKEENGNQLLLKINNTLNIPLNSKVELDIDQIVLNYSRTSDEHYEKWVGELEIPNIQSIHAGEMKLNVIMQDSDQGISQNQENILNIYNSRPYFYEDKIIVQIGNLNLTQNSATQYNYEPYPVLDIYIFAADFDGDTVGVKTISISAVMTSSQGLETWTREYPASAYYENGTYHIEIDLTPYETDGIGHIGSFEITRIGIADNEYGYCDPIKFPSQSVLNNVNITISLFPTFKQPEFPWIWYVVGITGGVAIVGLGFVFYRRFISYRKYLDKDDIDKKKKNKSKL